MVETNRLPAPDGNWLDRERTIPFSFEGKDYQGFAGDTIASALAANGSWLLSRSFKYHRPRGVLTMAGKDANTLIQVDGEPNVLADRRLIEPGLRACAQNTIGNLERDWASLLGCFGRFLPAGFYYKAFFKPRGAFAFWEPIIRRMAGLGRVDLHAPHYYHDKAYCFSDVAVIGGGPAGMAAALEAAKAGAEVFLIEDGRHLGGSLNFGRFGADRAAAVNLRQELVAAVEASPNITVFTDAVCQALFADNWLPVTKGNRLYKVRAASVVVATGGAEQHIVFRNNDLPGIMMGSAAQRLIRLYGIRPGKRAVIATTNGSGYGVALDLAEKGVEVAAIVDLRDEPLDCPLSSAGRAGNIPVLSGYAIVAATANAGNRHVTGVIVSRSQGPHPEGGPVQRLDCDLVCMCGGSVPAAALLRYAGADIAYDEETAAFVVQPLDAPVHAAGTVNGVSGLKAIAADGRHAGWQAARDGGFEIDARPARPATDPAGKRQVLLPVTPHPKGKDFVDYDEDLQACDIVNTVADGYTDVELLKRYSTIGMGPSQGRHSALPAARLAAGMLGRSLDDIGVTTARPPVGPITFAHLAGRQFEPVRRTAMHHRHLEMGATMMLAGPWLRPAFYGPEEEKENCIRDETIAVRNNVGMIDVSTLGGLEVRGTDAAEFMNRIYAFSYTKQPVGRGRYVLMTDETGAITDDGIAARFHERHFYVTATTGGVDAVYQHMLWNNAQWCLNVDITNVTAAYCGINIAGPNARVVLAPLCDDVDLSAEAFPYMGATDAMVAGIPARILRVGFVGELGYELHAPSDRGEALWDALLEAGRDHDIRPFGVEAQRVLRLEKGHIIVGQDTDGLTHPFEAGMGWAIGKKKKDFIGKRAIEIRKNVGTTRQLVGFILTDGQELPPADGHIIVSGPDIVGHVTSAAFSHALGKVVGLAYAAPDQHEPGAHLSIKAEGGRIIDAEVVALPFYDPENKRQEL
jgi:sarcosine oxidase subunit alpha